jgi:uncharacterized protein YdeI (YjbR/CyaY-like superfamily)
VVESVDEALCYGWIDGVRRSLDDQRYTIRFTPRKPRSVWSKVNMGKVVSAKKPETRARRLAVLIEHSSRGERLPQTLSPGRKATK